MLCSYINDKKIMDNIEKARLNILKVLLILKIILKLINVVEKYKNHFEANLTILNNILNSFNERTKQNFIILQG